MVVATVDCGNMVVFSRAVKVALVSDFVEGGVVMVVRGET
jgi:hypothetical protein